MTTDLATELVPAAPAPAIAPAAPVEGQTFTIAEVAQQTGMTAHTLRYYERIGLLDVPRDAAGRRRYTELDLARVRFIGCLRKTAMPMRDIETYFRLVAAGPETEPQRLALLESHRAQVLASMDELRGALAAVDYKIGVYGGSAP